MNQTVGIGIIGMGWMGEAHARAYNAIPDRFHESGIVPKLVICADAVEARADEARRRFGFAESTTDWQAVIDHPEVEVVDVTAPNGLHLEINRAVAAAGKHLACEKPVGRVPAETIASWELVRDLPIVTSVGFNYRWAPMVQYAKQLIANGALGRITHYHGRFLNGYAGDPLGFLSWRFEAEHGLGTLGDLASHVIDMAHFLAGPMDRLTANREVFIHDRPIPRPGVGTHYDVATGDERGLHQRPRPFPRRRTGHPGGVPGRERREVRHVVRGLWNAGRPEVDDGGDERAAVPTAKRRGPG
jgi:predicted dehydrogenase